MPDYSVTVEKNTLEIIRWRQTDVDAPMTILEDNQIDIETSNNPEILIASFDDTGNIELIIDSQRLVSVQETMWTSVRAQQKELLYKSDWTCSVTDYEVPNKADWVAYRQALRDVTTQSDPFAIVWPAVPSE
jgi:hypothetical protein